MNHIKLPTVDRLNELFYLSDDFSLLHKKKCGVKEGSTAGNVMPSGYIRVKCDGKMYLAHRIIFKITTGIDPLDKEVDHIDTNKANNNPLNLRLATRSQNRKNIGRYKNNSTGIKGVWFDERRNAFFCAVQSNKKRTHYGPFSTAEEAGKKYTEVAKLKFGEFFNTEGD